MSGRQRIRGLILVAIASVIAGFPAGALVAEATGWSFVNAVRITTGASWLLIISGRFARGDLYEATKEPF